MSDAVKPKEHGCRVTHIPLRESVRQLLKGSVKGQGGNYDYRLLEYKRRSMGKKSAKQDRHEVGADVLTHVLIQDWYCEFHFTEVLPVRQKIIGAVFNFEGYSPAIDRRSRHRCQCKRQEIYLDGKP